MQNQMRVFEVCCTWTVAFMFDLDRLLTPGVVTSQLFFYDLHGAIRSIAKITMAYLSVPGNDHFG